MTKNQQITVLVLLCESIYMYVTILQVVTKKISRQGKILKTDCGNYSIF